MPDEGLITLSGWSKGLTNTASDFAIPDGYVRDAVNVDVLDSGDIVTRDGITPFISSPGAHSVFSTPSRMFWATADSIYFTAGGAATLLGTSALYASPISWVELNGEVYFSNEQINGKITATNVLVPWGITPPLNAPLVSGTATAGTIGARRYQVTCTFVTATGEESGAPLASEAYCTDSLSISVSSVPQSTDPRVTHTRLYATDVDGQQFHKVVDLPAAQTTYTINVFPSGGKLLTTQFNGPPPTGQLIEYHNGKIYIASGNTVWETEALNYGIVDNVSGFTMYPSRVVLLKAVPDGMFISLTADKTYFLRGMGTAEVVQVPVGNYPAVEGAACNVPDSTDVIWFTLGNGGVMQGSQGGLVKSLTPGNFTVPNYTRGSATYAHAAGHKKVLGVFGYGTPSTLEHPDYAEGEIRRLAGAA